MANRSNPFLSIGRRQLSPRAIQDMGWLLAGLLIGLLIGWLIWPAQWTDTGMDSLRPAVRAQFVSATADAYVASGGQDPATALARMQSFADPQAAVFEAIDFYRQSNDPRRAIREVNLRSLASALGAQPPASAAVTSRPGAEQAISWLNWVFGLFTALVLLAGGLWIGRRVWAERQVAQTAPANEDPSAAGRSIWVGAQPHTPAAPRTAESSPGWQPSAPDDQAAIPTPDAGKQTSRVVVETWDSPDEAPPLHEPAPSVSSPTTAHPPAQPPDNQDEIQRIRPRNHSPAARFDTDETAGVLADRETPIDVAADEGAWADARDWKRLDLARQAMAAAPSQAEDEESGWVNDMDAADGSADAPNVDAGLDEIVWKSDDSGIDAGGQTRAEPAFRSGGEITETLAIEPADAPDEQAQGETGLLPTVQSVLSTFRRGEKEVHSPDAGADAGLFIAEYHAGILAYEQSFTIEAPGDAEGAPLGACGVGISEELDASAAHSNNVHVLDVWLYDGVAVRTFNQYLISPGMDKETLASQAESSGTITSEPLEIAPGLTFRIAAQHLTLECRVTNADFLDASAPPYPLRHVRIEMTARSVG